MGEPANVSHKITMAKNNGLNNSTQMYLRAEDTEKCHYSDHFG